MEFVDTLFGGSRRDRLIYSALTAVEFDGSTSDAKALAAAGHLALINCDVVAGRQHLSGRSVRRAEKQLKREAYQDTMSQLELSGSISVAMWLLRPVFMWLLRRFLRHLIDRYITRPST